MHDGIGVQGRFGWKGRRWQVFTKEGGPNSNAKNKPGFIPCMWSLAVGVHQKGAIAEEIQVGVHAIAQWNPKNAGGPIGYPDGGGPVRKGDSSERRPGGIRGFVKSPKWGRGREKTADVSEAAKTTSEERRRMKFQLDHFFRRGGDENKQSMPPLCTKRGGALVANYLSENFRIGRIPISPTLALGNRKCHMVVGTTHAAALLSRRKDIKGETWLRRFSEL